MVLAVTTPVIHSHSASISHKHSPIRDVISGAIMAATSVPQLIAYAETVGYAGYRGLATAGPPLFAWGLVTGSPYMNSGVTSITALMAKTDLDGEAYVAEYGEEEYVKLVAAYSLYVGLASMLLAVVGFGSLSQRVPKTVRSGFKVCVSSYDTPGVTLASSYLSRIYNAFEYSGVALSAFSCRLFRMACLPVVPEN